MTAIDIHSSPDDILESFLSEYRQRKQRTGGGSLPPSTEEPGEGVPGGEEEEEEEGWFPIPELPSGHELVLNILSTWGDHYYVGLSGMEVFTAQGERAWVEEVGVAVSADADQQLLSSLECAVALSLLFKEFELPHFRRQLYLISYQV